MTRPRETSNRSYMASIQLQHKDGFLGRVLLLIGTIYCRKKLILSTGLKHADGS